MLGWLLRLLLLFMLVRALMLIVGGLIRGLIGAAQVPGEPRQGTGAGWRGPLARHAGAGSRLRHLRPAGAGARHEDDRRHRLLLFRALPIRL